MRFKDFLTQSAHEIDAELQSFFKEWSKETETISPRLKPHLEAFEAAASGGKRIRGALVILGHSLISREPNPDLLKIAVAYELFQTAILAHDDIIDNSPTRRGKPSLHMALGGGHYGTSQAICLGDIGFFLAYKLINESNFDASLKAKATSFFSDSIIQTTIGEMLDVELAFDKEDATEADILAVARLKTAYYTFVAPLTLGAIIAGAEESYLENLKIFGENVGIAFQLQDDIHDVFGTEETLKKQVGGDVFEDKQTILYRTAMNQANAKQLEILKENYGNPAATPPQLEAVKKVFEETGARAYTADLAETLSKKAEAVIPAMASEEHLVKLLEEILAYVNKK